MDIENLWTVTGDGYTDDLNTVKSWLCNSTNGQTYSLPFRFSVKEIADKGYDYEYPESQFDEIVGFKHDYKVDDPELDGIARGILEGLNKLAADLVENPQNYFNEIKPKEKVGCSMKDEIHCEHYDDKAGCCNYEGDCPFKCAG